MVRFFLKPLSVRQMRLLCASLLAGFALCGVLQGLCWGRTQLDAGAALCADTLRLHIRAASDAVADQSAKLRVRDAVLAVMQQCPAQSAPEARAWAAGRLLQFQLAAQRALTAQGIRAPVRVYLVNMYFPARRYPTGQLPAGRYDAVRIDIGSGGVCCTRGCAALRRAATPCLRRTILSAGSTSCGSGWWTGRTG